LWEERISIDQPEGGKVVLGPKRGKRAKYEIRDADSTSALLVIIIGAAFAFVGLADLTLMWTPLRFGNPAWEFAIFTRTFTSVPQTGLGLLFVAYGLLRHPEWDGRWIRVAAAVYAFGTLALLVIGVLYLTVVPVVIQGTPVEGVEALGKAIAKTGVEMVAYPVSFALIAVLLWRGVKKEEVEDESKAKH
jgi:hypothetical protein